MMAKTIVTIIVILLVFGGIWWWMMEKGGYAPTTYSPEGANNVSDSDIDQDLAKIDAGASAFSSDSTAIDQSFNDQAVSQTSL